MTNNNENLLTTESNKMSELEIKRFAVLGHLSALCVVLGIPLGNVLAPLVLWLVKKGENEFLDKHLKEAVNFNINQTILAFGVMIVALVMLFLSRLWGSEDILFFVVNATGASLSTIAIFLFGLSILVQAINNAIRASEQKEPSYHYSKFYVLK